LLLFPLFVVLLNCPYPDPPVFCLFLSILLHTPAGGGVAAWRFLLPAAAESKTYTQHIFFNTVYILAEDPLIASKDLEEIVILLGLAMPIL